MNDDSIKQAFSRVKEDILYLGNQVAQLNQDITELKTEIKLISSFIEDLKLRKFEENSNSSISTNQQTNRQTENSSFQYINPTQNPNYPTPTPTPTDTPTVPQETGGLISPYKHISTGNEGVPTDKPTDRQTNQHIQLSSVNSPPDQLDRAQELLASLDNLKKEVRFKFKRLTHQEMQVFSLLYNLEDSGLVVDYKTLADKLGLSESSIRDYVGKIQKKGIPITKEKLNNKRILLHISQDLRKIASLDTILKLREL